VEFPLTITLALAVTWLALGAAYFSIYPVGFYVTSFGFAAYALAAAGRAIGGWTGSRASANMTPLVAVDG